MQEKSTIAAARSMIKDNPQSRLIRSDSNTDNICQTETIDHGEIKDRYDVERQKTLEGDAHFHRLGWKHLTVVLIVNAVALGSLGIPSAFASLGMVAGIILCLALGLIAIYTSYVLGMVVLKYPQVCHYADVGRLLLGQIGYGIFSTAFSMQLVLLVGSHCLTGKIAFATITESGICSILWSIISGIILLLLAIPPSFTDLAILGYIDFASILLAILLTMISTATVGHQSNSERIASGSVSTWSAWPKENLTFSEAIVAVNNIVFAYSFAAAQPSFMAEMHTPSDYTKSIWTLGMAEILIYTLTGALIYAFVGQQVQSPALLSAGPLWSRIVFGVALPVIFISGSINTTVVCRFIHGNIYRDSIVRYINTRKGWLTWLGLVSISTLVAWVIAE
ncbi:unnamed protein product, partial [Penicillium pancosmium]